MHLFAYTENCVDISIFPSTDRSENISHMEEFNGVQMTMCCAWICVKCGTILRQMRVTTQKLVLQIDNGEIVMNYTDCERLMDIQITRPSNFDKIVNNCGCCSTELTFLVSRLPNM